MSRPTKNNPRVKYIKKSRKGIPIFSWCKTYFEHTGKEFKQVQEWSQEKPI